MLKLTFALVLAAPAFPQALDFARLLCNSTTPENPKLIVLMPTAVNIGGAGARVSSPVCVNLGTSLRISTANGVSTLEAVLPAPVIPATPKPTIETFALPISVSATQETWDVTLSKTPAASTMLVAILRLSTGQDVIDVAIAAGNSRVVQVRLPLQRPFVPDDRLRVFYSTLE